MSEYIKSYLAESDVVFAGVKTDLAGLSDKEARAIVQQVLNEVPDNASPAVYALIKKHIPVLIGLVRRVKVETKSEFVGAGAQGKQLTIQICRPRFFEKAGTTMTTWLFTATAGADWFISGSGDAAIACPEEEGFVFLGWADPIDSPKVEAVQLEKGGTPVGPPQTLNFDFTEKYPVHGLKLAWVIQPQDSYRVQVRYFVAGDDKFMPIAFRVVKAETIMTI